MKRRSFLKGVVGLAAAPVVGVVVAKASDPFDALKSMPWSYPGLSGIDMGGGPDGVAAFRMAVDGGTVTVDAITNNEFYKSPVDWSQEWLECMGKSAGSTMNDIVQSIYQKGGKP